MGYDPHHKGYLCLIASGKTIFSRHVVFNEFIFPYSMPNNPFKFFDNTDIAPNHPLSLSPFLLHHLLMTTLLSHCSCCHLYHHPLLNLLLHNNRSSRF